VPKKPFEKKSVGFSGEGKSGWTPPKGESYNQEEFEALAKHCFLLAVSLLSDDKRNSAEHCSLTATLLIGMQKSGIKVAPEKKKANRNNFHKSLSNLIYEKGLRERVDAADLTEDALYEKWEKSGHNEAKFVVMVNSLLKELGF